MEIDLRDRVVFVSGASSGIGAATARACARAGARLIVAARRRERLEALAAELRGLGAPDVLVRPLDTRDAGAVQRMADGLEGGWTVLEAIVNNAGLSRGLEPLTEGHLEDWNEMIDTNVKGLLHVDRALVPRLVAAGRGTVVHIGSVAGTQVYPGGNVYCASKHAVDALTRGLRMDLLGSGVRVTGIDPGLVETEFSIVRFHGDTARASAVYRDLTPLTAEDVAEAVLYAITRPDRVSIAGITLYPADQASARDVHRGRKR